MGSWNIFGGWFRGPSPLSYQRPESRIFCHEAPGNTSDGSEKTTGLDVENPITSGINYRSLNWFSHPISTINRKMPKQTFTFPWGIESWRPNWLAIWIGVSSSWWKVLNSAHFDAPRWIIPELGYAVKNHGSIVFVPQGSGSVVPLPNGLFSMAHETGGVSNHLQVQVLGWSPPSMQQPTFLEGLCRVEQKIGRAKECYTCRWGWLGVSDRSDRLPKNRHCFGVITGG